MLKVLGIVNFLKRGVGIFDLKNNQLHISRGTQVLLLSIVCLTLACSKVEKPLIFQDNSSLYLQNREPLATRPYLELPLGTIKPKGWLKKQLEQMKFGMTGKLDSLYPQVLGERNGWLGGDGDGWERGPYWIDGLLPLAYILKDDHLIKKVKPWVEWTLNNQQENGYIGPIPFESKQNHEQGLQKDQRKDWWPKMVMLKVLKQYYSATQDKRVITALTKYFKYQLNELPKRPLDSDTFWANRRGADNLQIVYWLYNITGDSFLLELGEILHKQTFPWTDIFLNDHNGIRKTKLHSFFEMQSYPFDSTEIKNVFLSDIGTIHTVNLAQGLKQPLVRYQMDTSQKYPAAAKKALLDIEKYHGQPQGMYGGDEPLHGTDPFQGIEFCSISEMMFSLETMLKISGDVVYADKLERIVYNALPTQASDDFMSRQYFQAANQIQLSDKLKTSFESKNHKHTDFVFGIFTGYPCCTTNMHQAWPKFVQNLFYATPDAGVAALLYAPSEVDLKVGNNVDLEISEKTRFPFRDEIKFELSLSASVKFPFHFRIPKWVVQPKMLVNGEVTEFKSKDGIGIIERNWKDGDHITLKFPMRLTVSKWHQGASTIERGPLVYALPIKEIIYGKDRNDGYGAFNEFYPASDFNFGLVESELNHIDQYATVTEIEWDGHQNPWNVKNSPIKIDLKARKIDQWTLNDSLPKLPEIGIDHRKFKAEHINLIPYGCTTLRLTEFPTLIEN